MISARLLCIFVSVLILQSEILFFYYFYMTGNEVKIIIHGEQSDGHANGPKASLNLDSRHNLLTYGYSKDIVRQYMKESIYRYDRARNLPLMKLTPIQKDKIYRIALCRKWLKSQRLVVASTVRNAMNGLESSMSVIRQLSELFHSVTAVFVENDSKDNTRNYLHRLTKEQSGEKFRVYLLGCGTVNSAEPCHLNISYGSSGRLHSPGWQEQANRNIAEESTDRGLVMAALRNMYLQFIYQNLTGNDLLLVLESDLRWKRWNMNNIAQGLYHFKAKPKLDSLCAFATNVHDGLVQDPCTLIFFHSKYFHESCENEAGKGPFIDRLGRYNKLYNKFLSNPISNPNLPAEPVKVAACFQGATFYRLSSLRAASAVYRYSEGEWHCEHSTLSMQLMENYLDTQMQFRIDKQFVG